jgi:acyl-CoA hydrolase
MKGKTVKGKDGSMINIAHPDFRSEIRKEAYSTYFSR